MTTFLGPVGSLIPVKCASRLTSSGGREVSFTRTLGKQKAFLGRVTAREWSVDIGLANPAELSGLRWLAEYSHGPLVWYPPEATGSNILDGAIADFAPGTHRAIDGPLVEVEPGVWVKSVLPSQYDHPFMQVRDGELYAAPIPTSGPVTVSVWLKGNTLASSQRLRVIWRDINGTQVSYDDANFDVANDWARRSVTLTPPAGATRVTLHPYAAQVAGPAITLTDRLVGYSSGRGATRVVVHGLADAVIRATESQQLQSLSFTVTEVG